MKATFMRRTHTTEGASHALSDHHNVWLGRGVTILSIFHLTKERMRNPMFLAIKRLWEDEDGLTTIEYALLLVLIVIVGITAWQTFGGPIH